MNIKVTNYIESKTIILKSDGGQFAKICLDYFILYRIIHEYRLCSGLFKQLITHWRETLYNIKSNQINFIHIKSSHRTVTSHMYTVTQEQSQT